MSFHMKNDTQDRTSSKKSIIIALVGKGGTGKSAIAAMIVKVLRDEDKFKILAIDADPAMGLADTLGIEVSSTIADISDKMRGDPVFRRRIADVHISNVIREIVQHERGFDMLSLGHDEGPGCYCGINELLKYGVGSLSRDIDVVLIDGEAGIEQVKRRVFNRVNFMMGISDMSARGLRIADLLRNMVQGSGQTVQQCDLGLVVNKARQRLEPIQQIIKKSGVRVIGYIPEDESILEYDLTGRSLLELSDDSPAILATRSILRDIGLVA
jgi:CO dehydrogenase maturation factor